ncbi:Fas apoptotic inhibitory molecule 1 [Trinorchestia longiramus]|nr:Fas apoptotic inhibitory molecule 1 [Trinorchestia longiramus]
MRPRELPGVTMTTVSVNQNKQLLLELLEVKLLSSPLIFSLLIYWQPKNNKMGGGDQVATWEVRLSDGVHLIEFEHGTTTGKRLVLVDSKEVVRKEWMFKLVGSETFEIGNAKCVIKIEPMGGFAYEYSLEINGQTYKKFREKQSRILRTWVFPVSDAMQRVVLERDTLDVWLNGDKLEVAAEFVDGGTETHFDVCGTPACIYARSSGSRREGIIHALVLDGEQVPEAIE